MRYPEFVQVEVERAPGDARVFLDNHNPIKVRMTILFSRFLRQSFGGEISHQNDLVALAGAVVFNNVDELIDDGFIVDPGEKRKIVNYFRNYLKEERAGTLDLEGVDPFKLKELEFLCRSIREKVLGAVGESFYFDVFDDLAAVVIQQVDQQFDCYETPEAVQLLVDPIEDFIRKYDFPVEVLNRLRLAVRMGAYTAAILAPAHQLSDEDKQALFFFGAAAQVLDDLCDLEDDLEKSQDTFAVEASKHENSVEMLDKLRTLKAELFTESYSRVKGLIPRLKIRLFKIIFEIFSYLNSSAALRKKLNSSERLGVVNNS